MAKILLVDDAQFMRLMLRQLFERNNHQIVGEATNGKEGVTQYFELKPDLVMMDITMPEMDGIGAVKQICANEPEAKIIMCSAMGQEGMVKDAIMSGAKDFIVKPFQPDRVLNAVNKLLAS